MKRLQRLRRTQHLRDLVSEVGFNQSQLIQPIFVVDGISANEPIPALMGNERMSISNAKAQVARDLESGVRNFILFTVPKEKRARGFQNDFAGAAIQTLKKEFGEDLTLWVDTCLCSVTSTGHCCVFADNGAQDLEATLEELSNMTLTFAQAGADGVSPSDMNDGRVGAMRAKLDQNGFDLTPIMSYSTKFASNFYGPFRCAADSAPKFGDRKSYQLDVRARLDAISSSVRCAEEGADLLMVKPGMTSLDLIKPIAEAAKRPVGAYQVSGEYASLCLLAKEGFLHFNAGLLETWYVLRRGGASFVITYGARLAKQVGL